MKAVLAQSAVASVTVRPALEADLPLIRMLAQRIWPICYAAILTPEQIANMLECIYSETSLLRQAREGQRFWLGYSGQILTGYASAYKEAGTIWLKKLYVDAALQGRGIGARMMEAALASFLPASDIRLLVNRDNLAAQKYYEHQGFSRISEVPVIMGDFPFVDYLYRKPLRENSQ